MKNYLLTIFLMLSILSFGQKFQILSGNTNFLSDQKEINVELVFDNVKFYNENKTETEYLEKREKDVLDNPKRGESYWKEWLADWNENKNSTYLDKFIKGTTKSKKINFVKNSSAKYTLIINSEWIYPGYHAGIAIEPAKLSTTLHFIETANPSHILLSIKTDKIKGTSGKNDFVMEYGRIASAYESTGKLLSKELKNY
ncbi:hypothetical protein IF125_11730 [Empedobacter stercoris]|uniref:hypothetical protein n=1 Tax=Empedobacter stercoris TaxID=1628248 RepID=UPI001CE04581|nr:hypothetical protein [Empedobacter stercoris]MCA4782916.1 hypothetical protein [Empedobacter stercoris]